MHAVSAKNVASAGIAFYIYFLVTQREFAYREWKNQMMTSLQVRGMLNFGRLLHSATAVTWQARLCEHCT